jgi:hypothetical protein
MAYGGEGEMRAKHGPNDEEKTRRANEAHLEFGKRMRRGD